jgi:PHD/YefM family antitoxin component YafN of YafNO toxin-antitoxin module
MIDPLDVYPLTDFQRDAKEHIRKLRKNRRPQLLTVNGRAAVVVLDPETYADLSRFADGPSVVEKVRRGIADMNAGRAKPADEVLDRIKAKVSQKATSRRRSA